MSLDVEALRSDTPGCSHVAHFNHAGTGLASRPVLDAVVGHLELEAAIGGYEAAARAADRLEDLYAAAARLIGAAPTEIAFTGNATTAWALAAASIGLSEGDRVLIAPSEYGNNVLTLGEVARRTGAQVEVVDPADLAQALDERVRLVAMVHVGVHFGAVQPVVEAGRLARDAGALYLVDAAQSVGHIPVDVGELGCDLLAATGRKWLRGPRGTGFLYVSAALLERFHPPLLDTATIAREDARRFELWEQPLAAKVGLGVAIEYALDLGIDAIAPEIADRAARVREALEAVPRLTLREAGPETGIVTFTIEGLDPVEVATELRERRINLSALPPPFAPHSLTEPVLRASPHYLTTQTEINALAAGLRDLASAG